MTPKAPGTQVADVRSASERALAESQANYFGGLMDKPNFGYESQTAAHDPLYDREMQRYKQMVAGSAAEKGFGALRHGPSMSMVGRGAQEMAENRASQEAGNMENYRQWVISGGKQAATPTGRTAFQTPGRPSAFSQLAGPVLGAVGTAVGGPVGGYVGSKVGGAMGGQQDQGGIWRFNQG